VAKVCFGATPKVRAGLALARVTPARGGQAVRYPELAGSILRTSSTVAHPAAIGIKDQSA
jgi:hypothetical protein